MVTRMEAMSQRDVFGDFWWVVLCVVCAPIVLGLALLVAGVANG